MSPGPARHPRDGRVDPRQRTSQDQQQLHGTLFDDVALTARAATHARRAAADLDRRVRGGRDRRALPDEGHPEPASAHTRESGEPTGEAEGAHAEVGEVHDAVEGQPSSAHGEARETLLGVDIESARLIVLAVIAGLALAALVAAP